jgi:uncharacterized repeat protein (TIGR03803 family)
MRTLNGPRPFLLLAICALLVLGLILHAADVQAQTYSIIHAFTGPDGLAPAAGVIPDAAGNLYGTTAGGSTGNCNGYGCGTVFKLTNTNGQWAEEVIHSFQGNDGWGSYAPVTLDASGNVFATTGQCTSSCNGTAVELTPQQNGTWNETVLHSFGVAPDGSGAFGGLLLNAAAGTLYGTTEQGGMYSIGTVYTFSGSGYSDYSIVYSFAGRSLTSDGFPTFETLARDAAGNLYGTGEDLLSQGTIFKLSPNQQGGWTETILHRFVNLNDGADPIGGVILDASGNLYGETYDGGPYNGNYGVVYKLAPNPGGPWTYSILYAFQGGNDGSFGSSAPTLDALGNLYGTTAYGGTGYDGTIFKLTPTGQGQWTKTTLHNFQGQDGALPYTSQLWITSQGTIYGTTEAGGPSGRGVVFQITQ